MMAKGAGVICDKLHIEALSDGILPLRIKWKKFCLREDIGVWS
jgi:hypothetical protein